MLRILPPIYKNLAMVLEKRKKSALTHFLPMRPFSVSWKHRKSYGSENMKTENLT